MGNPKAFLTIPRKEAGHRPTLDRTPDVGEVAPTLNPNDPLLQATRRIDSGVPT